MSVFLKRMSSLKMGSSHESESSIASIQSSFNIEGSNSNNENE